MTSGAPLELLPSGAPLLPSTTSPVVLAGSPVEPSPGPVDVVGAVVPVALVPVAVPAEVLGDPVVPPVAVVVPTSPLSPVPTPPAPPPLLSNSQARPSQHDESATRQRRRVTLPYPSPPPGRASWGA
ncbi:MAG: hypothetical protein IPN32_29575 [Deltaproteobacteria bacterium]|nr:hypothetical protein [Deltaproteobacteria bacterium]